MTTTKKRTQNKTTYDDRQSLHPISDPGSSGGLASPDISTRASRPSISKSGLHPSPDISCCPATWIGGLGIMLGKG
ncbi:hypothetical protein LB506_009474 [Fusarium annulatum]|nr:hypothetical protein LB506_009474 [Fusarium annulatum]